MKFGYKTDNNTNTFGFNVHPGAEVYGHHITVGQKTYIFQGKISEICKHLLKSPNQLIVGKSLNQNGNWQQQNSIKILVTDVTEKHKTNAQVTTEIVQKFFFAHAGGCDLVGQFQEGKDAFDLVSSAKSIEKAKKMASKKFCYFEKEFTIQIDTIANDRNKAYKVLDCHTSSMSFAELAGILATRVG